MISLDPFRRKKSFILQYALRTLAAITVIAVLVRLFFFASFVMSGWGMVPSVLPGDFIAASKWSLGRVQRGDVVFLHCPSSPERTCLKRVVGLPGDRIEIDDGRLILNGQRAHYDKLQSGFQVEAIAGRRWAIWPEPTAQSIPALAVPPDQVYVLNDRRADRQDSRTWGPVSIASIEARAWRVWLSLDWYEGEKVRSWPQVRWQRLLRGID